MIHLYVYMHICSIFVHVVVYVCAFMRGGGCGVMILVAGRRRK